MSSEGASYTIGKTNVCSLEEISCPLYKAFYRFYEILNFKFLFLFFPIKYYEYVCCITNNNNSVHDYYSKLHCNHIV